MDYRSVDRAERNVTNTTRELRMYFQSGTERTKKAKRSACKARRNCDKAIARAERAAAGY